MKITTKVKFITAIAADKMLQKIYGKTFYKSKFKQYIKG